MNEEKAVLDFFTQTENLPLGLAVAEHMDGIREQMNSRFWHAFQKKLDILFSQHAPEWKTKAIEDRNTANLLVGLQCVLREPQASCLLPMMEQQYIGGTWRIFSGLMWNGTPQPLPAVNELKQSLADANFKSNEQFLAWQWTNFYPQKSDFLLRFARQPEQLLNEIASVFKSLSLDRRELISQANTALKNTPATVLRNQRTH
jgi:hypothetical protein